MADEQKLATLYVEVKAKTDELQKQLDALKNKTGDTAKQMSSGFSGVTSTLAKLGIGALGVSTAFNFLKSAVTNAREAQIAFAQVEQAVRQTGGSAGYSAKQLKQLADALESAVSIDADTILKDVSLQLLTFGKVQGDVFKRAQTAVLDLSAVLGSDLKGQTIQLAKALEDPARGLTALSKSGITFTEVQKENIKNLVAQNDLYGAQTIILDEINAKYGGQAEALNKANGGFTKLAVSIGNISESIGNGLLKVLSPVVDTLNIFSDGINEVSSATEDLTDGVAAQKAEFNNLINILLKTNISDETRSKIISELNSKYPTYLNNINLEKAGMEELLRIKTDVNDAFEKEIRLNIQKNELKNIITDIVNVEKKLVEAEKKYQELQSSGEAGIVITSNKSGGFGGKTKGQEASEYIDELNNKLNVLQSKKNQIGITVDVKDTDIDIKISLLKNELQKELDNKPLFIEITPYVESEAVTKLKQQIKDLEELKKNNNTPTPTSSGVPNKSEVETAIDDYKKLKKSVEDFQNAFNKETNPEIKAILKVDLQSAQEQLDTVQLKAGLKIDEVDFDAGNINEEELTTDITNNILADEEKKLQIKQEFVEYQKQLQQDYVDAVGLLNDKAYQSEVDRLNAEYEAEIAKYGLTEEAKAVHDEKMLELATKRQEEEDTITEAQLNNYAALADAMSGFSQLASALGGEDTAAFKAMAITEATIATYLAATKALLIQPPWVGAALAAGTVAAGLANVANIISAHDGGTFQNGKKISSFAQGGAFTVPQGYPNDSFPMLVESGEKVIVVPRNKANQVPEFSGGTKTPSDVIRNTLGVVFGVDSEITKNYKTSVSSNTVNSNNNTDVVNAIGALNRNISNLDRKVIELDIDGKNLAKIVLGTINDMESSGYDTSFM